jgi:hypothetical protein
MPAYVTSSSFTGLFLTDRSGYDYISSDVSVHRPSRVENFRLTDAQTA